MVKKIKYFLPSSCLVYIRKKSSFDSGGSQKALRPFSVLKRGRFGKLGSTFTDVGKFLNLMF